MIFPQCGKKGSINVIYIFFCTAGKFEKLWKSRLFEHNVQHCSSILLDETSFLVCGIYKICTM